jgi:hypothetical protein
MKPPPQSAHPIEEGLPTVPILKNRMFQPLGVMLSSGTMLHVSSRAEHAVAEAELDAPHVRAMLASGQLMVLARPVQAEAPSPDPPPQPLPRRRRARKA